jgi:hypothetical protein
MNMLKSTYDPDEQAEAIGPVFTWPSGVRIQEQRNKYCSVFTLMECPNCGTTDEPNQTDGDAYECRCCDAIHEFPPLVKHTP